MCRKFHWVWMFARITISIRPQGPGLSIDKPRGIGTPRSWIIIGIVILQNNNNKKRRRRKRWEPPERLWDGMGGDGRNTLQVRISKRRPGTATTSSPLRYRGSWLGDEVPRRDLSRVHGTAWNLPFSSVFRQRPGLRGWRACYKPYKCKSDL